MIRQEMQLIVYFFLWRDALEMINVNEEENASLNRVYMRLTVRGSYIIDGRVIMHKTSPYLIFRSIVIVSISISLIRANVSSSKVPSAPPSLVQ